jgi:hypothetical protein
MFLRIAVEQDPGRSSNLGGKPKRPELSYLGLWQIAFARIGMLRLKFPDPRLFAVEQAKCLALLQMA